jgi:hypothetical protein
MHKINILSTKETVLQDMALTDHEGCQGIGMAVEGYKRCPYGWVCAECHLLTDKLVCEGMLETMKQY